jgi:integrase
VQAGRAGRFLKGPPLHAPRGRTIGPSRFRGPRQVSGPPNTVSLLALLTRRSDVAPSADDDTPRDRRGRPRPRVTLPGGLAGRRPVNAGNPASKDILTRAEMNRLLASFSPTSKNEIRNRAMVAVMCRAGLKVGKVVRMEPRHYERGGGTVTVPGDREEHVAIDPLTRELLDEWIVVRDRLDPKRRPARLFCTTDRTHLGYELGTPYIRTFVARHVRKAGIRKDISPERLRHTLTGAASNRVERHVATHVDEDILASRYPNAYEKWCDACGMYEAHPTRQASRIGHDCRDAMTEFLRELALLHGLEPDLRGGPVDQLRRIYRTKRGLSEAVTQLLDATVILWGGVSDLMNRQEHAARRENERLVAEDGRRLVFQTVVAMYEIDRALSRLS